MIDDISAKEAFDLLEKEEDSYLIDVRSDKEIVLGHPSLSTIGKEAIFIEILAGSDTGDFTKKLQELLPSKASKLMFICRLGGRSLRAAQIAEGAGYSNCLNIESGFEGGDDKSEDSMVMKGWKASGLPWKKS